MKIVVIAIEKKYIIRLWDPLDCIWVDGYRCLEFETKGARSDYLIPQLYLHAAWSGGK